MTIVEMKQALKEIRAYCTNRKECAGCDFAFEGECMFCDGVHGGGIVPSGWTDDDLEEESQENKMSVRAIDANVLAKALKDYLDNREGKLSYVDTLIPRGLIDILEDPAKTPTLTCPCCGEKIEWEVETQVKPEMEYVTIGDGIFVHDEPCGALVGEMFNMLMEQAKRSFEELGATTYSDEIEFHINHQNEVTHVWWEARLPKNVVSGKLGDELQQNHSRFLTAIEQEKRENPI